MEYAIKADHLFKSYGKSMALEDLSLNVKKGESFGFLGPNGAGKTTFVKILLDLIFPDRGSAVILGENISKPASRKKVGFLPENMHVYPFLSINEFLFYHAKLSGMSSGAERMIEGSLKITGMYNEKEKKMGALSKGMKQRVGIAQAILNSPQLLILDEPTSGLDPIGIKDVRDILLDLKARGTTIFINSHLLSEIERTCDTIAILNRGRIIKTGNKSDLSEGSSHLEVAAGGINDRMIKEINSISSRDLELENDIMKIYLKREEDSVKIHAAVLKHNGKLLSLSWKRESLEDIFYRLVKGEEK